MTSWLDFPWREFVAKHHGKTPAVFRDVVREPFVSRSEALAALCAAKDGVADHAPSLRVYDGPETILLDEHVMPRASDGSVGAYVRRLAKRIDQPAAVANAFQSGSPRVLARSLDVLRPLHEHVGMPTGGALLDLFAGTYRRSPLGVHKDEQDVFTFVLEGTKRFLVWPYATLAKRFGVGGGHRRAPYALEDVDPEDLRRDATVLEAGPRDVVYWPASAWHYAESDGGVTVTLALGVFPRGYPLHLLERAARALRIDAGASEAVYPVDAFPNGKKTTALRHAALRKVLSSSAAKDAEAVAFETWRSAMGYARVPPPLERFALAKDDVVRVAVPEMLRWAVQRERLVVCAGGHALPLPARPAVIALLDRLADGRPRPVRALLRIAAGLAPDAVYYVLSFLGRSHVLVRD